MCYEQVESLQRNILQNLILLVPLPGMEGAMEYTSVLVSGSSCLVA